MRLAELLWCGPRGKEEKELRGETCETSVVWAKRERGEIREAARMMDDFSKPIGGAT